MQTASPTRGRLAPWTLALGATAALLLCAGLTIVLWRGLPSPAAAAYERGRSLAAAHLPDDARAVYEDAIRLDPAFAPAYRALAELAESQSDWATAVERWKAYVARDSRPAHGWCRIADDDMHLGLQAAAQQAAERELKLDPRCGRANLVAGLLDELRSVPYQAVKHLGAAAAAMPDDARVQRAYGRVLVRSGNFQQALGVLQRAVTLDPSRSEGYRWLGAVYARLGDTPENTRMAEQTLRRALEIDPHYAEAAYELGLLYADRGRMQEALPLAERAVSARKRYMNGYYLLARVDRALGKPQEAARWLAAFRRDNALILRLNEVRARYAANPYDVENALQLGSTLLALGDVDTAVRYLTDALAHNPQDGRLRFSLSAARGRLAASGADPASTEAPFAPSGM